MSPTLTCPSCGARWHTAARRGRTAATETCLRCGGPLAEDHDPLSAVDALYRLALGGDVEGALELCHPEIEVTELPELLPGEEHMFTGIAGARRWMELIPAIWDREFAAHRRLTRATDAQTVELTNDVVARSSHGHPDFAATMRSTWSFEDKLLRRVSFTVVGATAPDANRA